jgi:hypothetical protein
LEWEDIILPVFSLTSEKIKAAMKSKYIIVIPVLFLSACEKIDRPYELPPPGDVVRAEVNMGENYDTEIYFHFADKQQYTMNLNDWDLAFETGPQNYLIRMNGGKQVQVFNTGSTNFNLVVSTNVSSWQWDSPDGNPDSVALRGLLNTATLASSQLVYLIDRGAEVTIERYKKMQLQSVDAGKYQFIFANPDGSGLTNFTVEKDTAYNYMQFSFGNGGRIITSAPEKNKYDILFTRYRYIYYDMIPVLPYSVNGVLINPFQTSVAVDSITPFDNINYDFALSMPFSTKFDAVGFDWKTYNFTTSYYDVNPEKCYVLKNQEGVYYKFRFIDFYNSQGIKGCPEFEFQRL